MSFHLSAQGIELDGTTLKAELSNVDGDLVECEIELDEILGNDDGKPPLAPPLFFPSTTNPSPPLALIRRHPKHPSSLLPQPQRLTSPKAASSGAVKASPARRPTSSSRSRATRILPS